MNAVLKYSLIAVAIGGIIYIAKKGFNQASEWADKISFTITGFGVPSLKNGMLTLPLSARVVNPSPLSLPIDSISAKVFLLRNNVYQPFGSVIPIQNISLNPGDNNLTITPQVDIRSLVNTSSGIFSTIQQTIDLIKLLGSNVHIKADVTLVLGGVPVMESFEQDVSVSQLKQAA